MARPTELVRGTLDLLVLKTLELGPRHGISVAERIRQTTRGRSRSAPDRSSRRSTVWSRTGTYGEGGRSRRKGAGSRPTGSPRRAAVSSLPKSASGRASWARWRGFSSRRRHATDGASGQPVARLLPPRADGRRARRGARVLFRGAGRAQGGEGLSLAEARRAARREMGGEQASSWRSASPGWSAPGTPCSRTCGRRGAGLRSTPARRSSRWLTFALGIGSAAAILAVVHATLLTPAAVPRPLPAAVRVGGPDGGRPSARAVVGPGASATSARGRRLRGPRRRSGRTASRSATTASRSSCGSAW